jgi:uncharacterized protein YfiM (DUF2279 family)
LDQGGAVVLAQLAALLLHASPDPWLGVDKVEHVAASAFIAGDVYWLATAADASPRNRVLWGVGAALTAGAGKELVWDLALRRGDPSWRDFTADVVGAAVGVGISYFIDHVVLKGKP